MTKEAKPPRIRNEKEKAELAKPAVFFDVDIVPHFEDSPATPKKKDSKPGHFHIEVPVGIEMR